MSDHINPLTIISGGQTGVDRAALDVALEFGIACAGYCPQGRRAEDGPIPAHYPLQETNTSDYHERTILNVYQSDGTLIITRAEVIGGTALTVETARTAPRPYLIIDPQSDVTVIVQWLKETKITRLNVAGPRESEQPGIYQQARELITKLFLKFQNP